jgi:Rrf2 family protein
MHYSFGMDLGLSKTGDYAVRAAISLARNYGNGYRKIREVAVEMALPLRYTPQILTMLGRAGFAEARAGREGGYRLSRPPGDITLLEVVEAAEGPLETSRCTLRGGPCQWDNVCPVHHAWVAAGRALRDSLNSTSLADVAREDASLRKGRARGRV